jgi:diguanylate cyclase (GGDEF)-like protein
MHVSFRNRLTFFFIVLVILPVLTVAAVGILLVRDSENSRNTTSLARAQLAAEGLYADARSRAMTIANTVQKDDRLAEAVRDGDRAAQQQRLEALTERTGAVRVRLTLDGEDPVEAGEEQAIAATNGRVVDAEGNAAGKLDLSVTDPNQFADLLERVTGLDVVLSQDGKTLAGSVEGAPGKLPYSGDVEIDGEKFKATGFETPDFEGDGTLGVHVLIPEDQLQDSSVSQNTVGIFLILLAFLVCALAFALTAARSLGRQTAQLVAAAKQVGAGDFSVKVPTEGHDEFAQLGMEFNSMASQLQTREEELKTASLRLQESVQRVGESVGSGMDRATQLNVVVQTAVDTANARGGRVVLNHGMNGTLEEAARAGDVAGAMAAIGAAEEAVLRSGEPAEATVGELRALGRPLTEPEGGLLGVLTIARDGDPFSAAERETFSYLANQAALSVENVGLHETIQRQAVTDELTGLYNHRRFQEFLTDEVERFRRFGGSLGLMMLDIDDFKRVNDTYGHLQGDEVLREVARVLKESSREVDEPARYGGEEMAVALPQTGLQGAFEFAERVRARIQQLRVPLLEGDGTVRVTASFGVAALPDSAPTEKDALVAAADAALYRAKRSGKNRTMKSG